MLDMRLLIQLEQVCCTIVGTRMCLCCARTSYAHMRVRARVLLDTVNLMMSVCTTRPQHSPLGHHFIHHFFFAAASNLIYGPR